MKTMRMRTMLRRLFPTPERAHSHSLRILNNAENWSTVASNAFGGNSGTRCEVTQSDRGTITFRGVLARPDHSSSTSGTPMEAFAACQLRLSGAERDVGDFEGLAIRVRRWTGGHNFSINVKPWSLFNDDLYQAFVLTKADEKDGGREDDAVDEYFIPFHRMLLTGRGKVREIQRRLDTPHVDRIGISIGGKDTKYGPFEIELHEMKWMNLGADDVFREVTPKSS